MKPEAAELSGECTGRRGQVSHELVDGQRITVGELVIEMIADSFVGIEFGHIGRQAFDMKSRRMTSEQLDEPGAAINGAAVSQQQPQEGTDFEVAQVSRWK